MGIVAHVCVERPGGITFEQLDAIADPIGDNEPAQSPNEVRGQRFRSINNTDNPAA